MTDQLGKRTSTRWIEYVLEQFNDHHLSEVEACQLLEIKRSQLYELRQRWLKAQISKQPFRLSVSGQSQKRSLTKDIEDFLHQELSYIREKAHYFRGKFNRKSQ
jgi:hypothetical protein